MRQRSSVASSGGGAASRVSVKVKLPPMKRAVTEGVAISQSMSPKRLAKKGVAASTIGCSGSNQAAKARRGLSEGSSRKRTKACILWMSRLTALAWCRMRRIAGSLRSPQRTVPSVRRRTVA
ncbi:hypothetical protein GCM10017056_39340 [Seohaeicola zhoushanensis]|uniref:Uncharacterized protein n=1 Tax=Seohaeicola zhoushanensis TaxID=1569283 RepID=A0A8J3H1P5_9RHOB|nr:hypothetical protein GCM10017056_39340 [Seohaeicola zhoushanensis]